MRALAETVPLFAAEVEVLTLPGWDCLPYDRASPALRVMAERLADENIHVGPSDYVPWLNDNKLCFLRLEGALFGNVPMNIEVRLSVEDSPNSAGVVIDASRCCRLALDRGVGGALVGPSAFFCKHPPEQFTDDEAERMTEAFIDAEHRVAAE